MFCEGMRHETVPRRTETKNGNGLEVVWHFLTTSVIFVNAVYLKTMKKQNNAATRDRTGDL